MKLTLLSAALVAALILGAGSTQAASFSYHGSLQDSGKPAEGSFDIELTLYSAPSGGSVIGGPLIMHNVPVHGGSFSTEADFGPLAKSFSQAYVEVKVRTAGQGEFASLDTRAQVTPDTASVCPGAWTLQGNAGNPTGSYLGTADSQPLTFEVNAVQVGQITPSGDATLTSAPNVVFGSSANNVASGIGGATIAGGGKVGSHNSVKSDFATVSGGQDNAASGFSSAVGGGYANTASGAYSAVGGGFINKASGEVAFVAGGSINTAGGDVSFAAGNSATVRDATQAGNVGTCSIGQCGDYGTFVWGDGSSNTAFTSSGPNQFLIRATGGVAINGTPTADTDELTVYGNGNSNNNVNVHLLPYGATLGFNLKGIGGSATAPVLHIDQDTGGGGTATRFSIGSLGNIGLLGGDTSTNPLTVGTDTTNGNGAYLTPGGVWTAGSSRTFKEGFAQIDAGNILAKVIELPVQTWFYRNDHQEGRHMGPVAEDFSALFGLGNDDKHIGGVDESGVAFAAIQGLNRKVEDENGKLKQENSELRNKLDDVLARLSKLETKQGE